MRFLNVTKQIGHVAGVMMTIILASSNTASALEPTDIPEIHKVIRSYLLENPEVMLEVQQALEAKQQVLTKERTEKALRDSAETVFNSPHQAVVGNIKGDVTLVEFFDYNCPFCQRSMKDINQLLEKDSNLRVVMKELPILGEESVEASRISTAVYRLFPESYHEFHNKLLGLEIRKDRDQALKIARELGLNENAIVEMAGKPEVLDAFREANSLATSLGMDGTPSYVLGDEVLFGAIGYDALKEKVDNLRSCGSTVCS